MIPGILAAAILVLGADGRHVRIDLPDLRSQQPNDRRGFSRRRFRSRDFAPRRKVEAMAVIYTASMMVLLIIALRFVNPTQLVTRVGDR